ncbi:MAG: Gfo/Idh/MocA family oxidoreductase [Sulfuricella sp.]|nr:Gfo/Idh/MocA family oxidoreductase [Sulfuricella sp.]
MKTLVVGYGSIGARHARLLSELGCRTAVVSQREVDFTVVYHNLAEALKTELPDYVVIANATTQHHETLLMVGQLGFSGIVLVEKPIFNRCLVVQSDAFRKVFVAYNLRFHPVIQRLKYLLIGEEILSVMAYVGQYLPDWRPATDYRASYSASTEQGGGVLRDLSHELDYLAWMLGGWERVSAIGGHFSPLEITSDDVFALMLVTPACPIVTLQLNYLDRSARRFVLINTAKHTFEADLIKGTIKIDGDIESYVIERDDSYRAMHEAILSGDTDTLCSLDEGLGALRLIEAAEMAARHGKWMVR